METTANSGTADDSAGATSPFIDKAKSAGWRPKEEYEGDPEAWVDAEEFVKRAPLYEKNRKLKKELSDIKTVLHEVKGHISKVSEAAYRKAVADLEAKRDEAIDNGDRGAVREIDKQIKEAEAIKTTADEVHPAIKAWEDENGKWFYADPDITDFGLAHADLYLKRNKGDFAGAMESMEKAIKKAFPEKFENTRRKEPAPVETGGKTSQTKTFGISDLSDEQRKVMNGFVRQGIMSQDEYIKELASSGLIGGSK